MIRSVLPGGRGWVGLGGLDWIGLGWVGVFICFHGGSRTACDLHAGLYCERLIANMYNARHAVAPSSQLIFLEVRRLKRLVNGKKRHTVQCRACGFLAITGDAVSSIPLWSALGCADAKGAQKMFRIRCLVVRHWVDPSVFLENA